MVAGAGFVVELRRPLHRAPPHRRLMQRWEARQRRRKRSDKGGDSTSNWADAAELSSGCSGDAGLAILGVIVLAVVLVLAGPWMWLLVLFLVDLLLWIVLGLAGLAAWLLFRRPWQVVVVDGWTGDLVAAQRVDGRRRAAEHARLVEQRLASGMSPGVAVARP